MPRKKVLPKVSLPRMSDFTDIIQVLQARVALDPAFQIYSFYSRNLDLVDSIAIGELVRRAQIAAEHLSEMGMVGRGVLLFCYPTVETIISFLGALQAGAIVVPVAPFRRRGSDNARLQSIISDCLPGAAMGIPPELRMRTAVGSIARLKMVDGEGLDGTSGMQWKGPRLEPSRVAVLQYTSGSTGAPKGVMISHSNLLFNAAHIEEAFGLCSSDRAVMWLPLHHDMGLMGAMLQPIYSGYSVAFIRPSDFMEAPLKWLELISRRRATVSGGPNFAYDLCVQALVAERKYDLDLSSWKVAFNGAEAVRANTIRRFCKAFKAYGFEETSFRPCYGLAEATLLVSTSPKRMEPKCLHLSRGELTRNLVKKTQACAESVSVVSLGIPVAGLEVRVVNPTTLHLAEPNEIGEIWVCGPSVAQGYWGAKHRSSGAFRAVLEGSSNAYLRTGDLGFLNDGEVYIVGRLKDLLIIRGSNYHPDDIEVAVEHCHPAVCTHGVAALGIEYADDERLVVVAEVKRNTPPSESGAVAKLVRKRIADVFELTCETVILVRRGEIPKTTSGKIRRDYCRRAYLDGTLKALFTSMASGEAGLQDFPSAESLAAYDAAQRITLILNALRELAAKQAGLRADEVSPDDTLVGLGVDSLRMGAIRTSVEVATGVVLPFGALTAYSLRKLAHSVSTRLNETATNYPPQISSEDVVPGEIPLSAGQKALWFLEKLAPGRNNYTIARATRVRGPLQVSALRAAFGSLALQHDSLRMRVLEDRGLAQSFTGHIDFVEVDASDWNEREVETRMAEEARRQFDLEHGPIFTVVLFRRSPAEWLLLLRAHHIAVDLWSLGLILRDLIHFYQMHNTGIEPKHQVRGATYREFVKYQMRLLEGRDGDALWAYWSRQLREPIPRLNLPFMTGEASHEFAEHHFQIGAETANALKKFGQSRDATLYTLVLSVFVGLLYLCSGQDEFLVGILATGRTKPEFEEVVGYFVNALVLRAKVGSQMSFGDLVGSIQTSVGEALDHQDLPFIKLVERLRLVRSGDRIPLLQTIFVWQPSRMGAFEDLSGFVLSREGGRIDAGDLVFESTALPASGPQFDLTLLCAEGPEGIDCLLEYDTGRVTQHDVSRIASRFVELLNDCLADPLKPVSSHAIGNQGAELQTVQVKPGHDVLSERVELVQELIQRQAMANPEQTALFFRHETVTYGEMNARAHQLARYLISLGVRQETRIGVLLDRSHEMVIALLGILYAGAAFVPLDPDHPDKRLNLIVEQAEVPFLVTQTSLKDRLSSREPHIICLDAKETLTVIASQSCESLGRVCEPENLCYVMFTSGSTGLPKGVMIQHSSLSNFCRSMDKKVGCNPKDTIVALTGISFDISLLELLWPLTNGARVLIVDEVSVASVTRRADVRKDIQLSIFYFASSDVGSGSDQYRLLIEGAKYADEHGFSAVWTPERHFHSFGGLYPNPVVTSAALATVTRQIRLRAGSVVMPLHNPIRVAEEWSLVDNLSDGRVGVAFASGWHADDFVFEPTNYENRKEVTYRGIDTVRSLWRGESITLVGPGGKNVNLSLYPRPLQRELPVWVTSAGNERTFEDAGKIGANLLTHLLGQEISELAVKIRSYRSSLASTSRSESEPVVTVMLHTYVDESMEQVRAKVLLPFKAYLRSSVELVSKFIQREGLPLNLESLSESDMDGLLSFAAERYMRSSGLLGTRKSCLKTLSALRDIGVNEVACLLDFGVDMPSAMASLHRINEMREYLQRESPSEDYAVVAQAQRHGATMIQCTPSHMRMLIDTPGMKRALALMRVVMMGGEPLPLNLVKEVAEAGPGKILNMYGPTETTIWSSACEVASHSDKIRIGGVVANTELHILTPELEHLPNGIVGELYIGGRGVARGYLGDSALTAERFLPNPFSEVPGSRLYRTGDLARTSQDDVIELMGRSDQQIKLHGHRIELGDVEAALNQAPGVRTGVVVKNEQPNGMTELIAYVAPMDSTILEPDHIRKFLRHCIPPYMVPTRVVPLSTLPLGPNGKVDRSVLARLDVTRPKPSPHGGSDLQRVVADIWKELLGVTEVGAEDNFFDIGGHSLLMAEVHRRLQCQLGREFPLITLLEHPTITAIAHFLQTRDDGDDQREPLRVAQHRDALRAQRKRALSAFGRQ